MKSMFKIALTFVLIIVCSNNGVGAQTSADNALIRDVVRTLNAGEQVRGTEDTKSYKILFDAYLQLTKPPFEIGSEFNLNTIHPKMSQWVTVSGWAESNAPMAQAILKCKDRIILGLPYGRDQLPANYAAAGLSADIGVNDSLRNVQFPYLSAIETIAAFSTAEVYRLMEGGQTQPALDLAVATIFVLRQCCDRDFVAEKLRSIDLLSSAMSNLRDVLYTYMDKLSIEQSAKLALWELPFLRPDRGRLFLPEADRILAEAIIKEVFDSRSGNAIPEKFTDTFAEIQSKDAPLTRFGAAKRWGMIALVHGSLDASQERLKLIYDDWWRRWRVDEYDPILAISTQFDRTNPVRYAAVLYSIENITELFHVRNRLIAEVNGTGLAAGLCSFHKRYGTYPDKSEKTYGQSSRKRSDSDPFDKQLQPFLYQLLDRRTAIDTPEGRVWLEAGQAILWSRGQDHEDQRGVNHSDDGASGDIVLWPPVKSLQRAEGLIP